MVQEERATEKIARWYSTQPHKYIPKFEFDYSDDLTDYIYYSCNNEPGSDLEKF